MNLLSGQETRPPYQPPGGGRPPYQPPSGSPSPYGPPGSPSPYGPPGGEGGRPPYGPPGGGDPDSNPPIMVAVQEPKIQIMEVGQTVEFRCSARALLDPNQPVDVSWRRGGGGELPRDRFMDNSDGLLVITGIRATDSGTYVCTATDGTVVLTDEAVLNVEGKGSWKCLLTMFSN